jgi:HAD superfamily hydrolase (TIGR01509 family)
MPPAIRAAIFDMDGLMLDTEPIYKVAWQAAAAELGYELDDAFYASFVGRPTHDCERDLIERFGAAFPLDRFRLLWPRRWTDEVAAHGIHQKPGLTELLGQLEARGVALAVATSTDADLASFCLRAAGLDGRFGAIVTGDEITTGKPAPDIYLEAARRLDVDPVQCVALEDSEAGILAAARAGMVALLIPEGAPSPTAVTAAFRVLSSLTDVAGMLNLITGDAVGGGTTNENGRR